MSNSLDELLGRVADYWKSTGVSASPGATPDEFLQFEGRWGVGLPPDMSAFYQRFNGTDGADENLIAFWPLIALGTVPDKLGYHFGRLDLDSVFVFADYLISSHVYGIHLHSDLSRSSPVLWIDEARREPVAPSFRKFLEQYLKDPSSILL